MSEQEQPYSEWFIEAQERHVRMERNDMGVLDDHTRALRELRQRDEELARLRLRVAELEKEIDGIYEDAAGESM